MSLFDARNHARGVRRDLRQALELVEQLIETDDIATANYLVGELNIAHRRAGNALARVEATLPNGSSDSEARAR